jgi:hypothetical protein
MSISYRHGGLHFDYSSNFLVPRNYSKSMITRISLLKRGIVSQMMYQLVFFLSQVKNKGNIHVSQINFNEISKVYSTWKSTASISPRKWTSINFNEIGYRSTCM